ncbi:MAG: tRNA (guanosine(37)-N1)-methyltransferase TrmD [Candidatus Shapirobacteria bacterium]|nr:tRNA (guanosine(37)-N1)-methyltransferase TrmD [Candidatus Shapirobacteria bacterium]MDD4410639.1 tRNA (guanosine(37)-N1)-methyltransferase TrmD [Candidatus Shapirobacteria bacterium]
MKIDIVTLFPKMFESPFAESIIKRAVKNKIIDLKIYNLRDWALDSYGSVDDKPFGGDVGMLIRPEPVFNALESIKKETAGKTKIIMMSARGKKFDQAKAEELAKLDNLILIAGHYEGFDQRISDFMVDEEISIGDYVLTGGELPAMVITDAVSRLVPGVLGKDESSQIESFSQRLIAGQMVRTIEYPQYTRPREFMGHKVPEVLVGGDPKKIKEWQMEQIRKGFQK